MGATLRPWGAHFYHERFGLFSLCAYRVSLILDDNSHDSQDEKQHAQANRHPEQCLFHASPRCEHAASVPTGEPAQACTLAL